MAEIESAWPRYPDYRIDLVPCPGTARVWSGDLLLAESDSCLVLQETKHVDRLYFPLDDVHLDLFTESDKHTICPFKGEASYWSLTASDPPEDMVVWTYPEPFDEVAGIKGHVAFYQERVRIEVENRWPGADPATSTVHRFPLWGDAADLVHLIDVQEEAPGRFVGPSYRDTTRNVVEGGQLLGSAIVAAAKTVPGQRVTSAYMVFSKAASFDAPIDVDVEVLRHGRTFSTVEVRAVQNGQLRSPAILLMDSGAADIIRGGTEMPDVPGPSEAVPYDFRVTGRDLRVIDAAYDPDPDRIGPPVIYSWVRFRDSPAEQYMHDALLAQSTTHWTIGAALRPHKGFGEAEAHRTLSTGIMSIAIAFHDEADVTDWLLYANPAIYAGRGLAQGEGHVFTQDGRLVASYTVQAMIRGFNKEPAAMGMDDTNVM